MPKVAWAAACLAWHGQTHAWGGMGSRVPGVAWAAVPSVPGRGATWGEGHRMAWAVHALGGMCSRMHGVACAAACLGWHGQLRA